CTACLTAPARDAYGDPGARFTGGGTECLGNRARDVDGLVVKPFVPVAVGERWHAPHEIGVAGNERRDGRAATMCVRAGAPRSRRPRPTRLVGRRARRPR